MKTQYFINAFNDGSAMWIVELTPRRFVEHCLDEHGEYSKTITDPDNEAKIGNGQKIAKDYAMEIIKTFKRIDYWNKKQKLGRNRK